jgi:tRNA threonylcarbamoyladenosine biosynthesis protein TsaE
VEVWLPGPSDTEALGRQLAALLIAQAPGVVTLQGGLGAGKTTLVRALLRALGVGGAIRSPTYTLVEPYAVADLRLLHMDLYRLNEPDELLGLGVFDDAPPEAWWLVEWPEKAAELLPPVGLAIELAAVGDGRRARLRGWGVSRLP